MEKVDSDLCVICHAHGEDKRFLSVRCLYAVDEVVPELKKNGDYYEGWICKSCRAQLLGKMGEWRDERVALQKYPKDHDGYIEEIDPDKVVPVRINGAIVMMTEEEFHARKKK